MMPQWDFLDFLAREARRYPGFELSMNAEVTSLVERDGRIRGVKLKHQEILADLVIGADGRHSTVRAQARLQGEEFGVPMDVLWFRLSRKASDPEATMGRFTAGRIVILLNRGDYWQCGYVISKGAAEEVRRAGLPAFRAGIGRCCRSSPSAPPSSSTGRELSSSRCASTAAAVVPAGPAVHRRCGARDVASRRRRHQSRDPGCRGGRQHSGNAAQRQSSVGG